MANLVIVESPSKAATIKGYLGSNYKVIASKGHIRDLPKSTLGVDIENNFAPHYINIRGRGDVISQLKKEAHAATKIFLATDPDREGEAISWHLATVLGIPLSKECRVTFNEITKAAVKEAIRHPRKIDEDLVNSQQARRILDRIVGYKLSPLLWKNVKSGLSAGRVQSVATRIIVEREEEIRAFVPREYWTLESTLRTGGGEELTVHYVGKRKLENEVDARALLADIENRDYLVRDIHVAEKKKQPAPPFTTSTLQQEASRKLGFQSQRIMKVAQELYEGINLGSEFGGVQGLITYMRTDSLRVSSVAQEAALAVIREQYGEEYLPSSPRVYKTKGNAQDAHEAIRPSNVAIMPKMIKKMLTSDQYRLYKLIWSRFVASQMASAVLSTTTIELENGKEPFRASGYTVKSQGFMAVYDTTDIEKQGEDGHCGKLPPVSVGESMKAITVTPDQHFTEPPPHYTEASLIKFLEENGIGRPSTYTPIITTIISRSYIKRNGKALVSTPLGEVTTRLMKEHFPDIVNYEFTATMEDRLDSIEGNQVTMEEVLTDFYVDFEKSLESAKSLIQRENVEVPADESDVVCELCGKRMIYKNGRFGRFLACPGYPTCRNTKAIDKNGAPVVKTEEKAREVADFKCELCGGDMVLRTGRYGSFYACVNYPKCRFTKQKMAYIGVDCPDCGAKLIAKHSRGKVSFYSCERYPECDFSTWDMPLDEKCPQCGKMLFFRKSRSTVLCRDKKCGYKREEVATLDAGKDEEK